MNSCGKYILLLFFVIFSDLSFCAESNINEDSLREISKHIISKDHIFDAIKDKLRKFHCVDAKNVWIKYNKATLPKAIEPEYENITVGNLIGVIRKDILSLVGDTQKTFYTASQINSIESEVIEAVHSGKIVINPRNEKTILITYNLNKNFGELCVKNKIPPLNPQCQEKQIIEIIIDAENYINYVEIHGIINLKDQNFDCKINNIYSK